MNFNEIQKQIEEQTTRNGHEIQKLENDVVFKSSLKSEMQMLALSMSQVKCACLLYFVKLCIVLRL